MTTKELLDRIKLTLQEESTMSYISIDLLLDEIKEHIDDEYTRGYEQGSIDAYVKAYQ